MNTVLIVESDEVSALVAKSFLERHRLRAITIDDSDTELMEACISERPDIVLINYRFYGVATLNVLQQIRDAERRAKTPRLPIVVTSACIGIDWESQSIAAGADRVLPMPFDERKAVNIVWGAYWDVRYHDLKGDPLYELLRASAEDEDEDEWGCPGSSLH